MPGIGSLIREIDVKIEKQTYLFSSVKPMPAF